ncbi:hypothetical protein MNSC_11160 [Minisyncoccus archaeophilus]|uniref:hypothetical protein n=1 Tax=Minisyncoccus archaeiphilus TaxID=3238481 RepID=UPI00399CF01D
MKRLIIVLFSLVFIFFESVFASCGTAHNVTVMYAPQNNLCSNGFTATSVIVRGENYVWTCYDTTNMTYSCSAPITGGSCVPQDGVCGNATNYPVYNFPAVGHCSIGELSASSNTDTTFNWNCLGLNGGNLKNCFVNKKKDAVCGDANGKSYTDRVHDTLCSIGSPGTISNWPSKWGWTCFGVNGGLSVSCSANKLKYDGVCGTAHGKSFLDKPITGLCEAGNSGGVNGSSTNWFWDCSGVNGGSSVSCSAIREMPEVTCGFAHGQSLEDKPTAGLCNTGSSVTVYSSSNKWTWNCAQIACYANKLKIDGICGSANEKSLIDKPITGLCDKGYTPAVNDAGDKWTWTCYGKNGGGFMSCYANKQKVDGACGSANGNTFSSKPTQNLCTAGYTNAVDFSEGKWIWTCYGQNGGSNATCSANGVKINGVCGSSFGMSFSNIPTSNLCSVGSASKVSGSSDYWTWTCYGQNGGNSVSCSAYKLRYIGVCGGAINYQHYYVPKSDLCSSGSASSVDGSGSVWSWTCYGTNGGPNASCSAPKMKINGVCGSSHGAENYYYSANLITSKCDRGIASVISFDDINHRWIWTCDGEHGGVTAHCYAGKSCESDNNDCGKCGSDTGISHSSLSSSSSGLCEKGSVSQFIVNPGNQPHEWGWTWICKVVKAVTCYANRQGVCGGAVNNSSITIPTSDLCSYSVDSYC